MLKCIGTFFSPPVFPDDEDKTRIAQVLNALLLSTTALSALGIIAVFYIANTIVAGTLLGPKAALVHAIVCCLVGLGTKEWVLVIRDMSREREMQAHIRQQDRLAVIGQLAGGVAHDFNNILTATKGYAGFAAEELQDNTPIRADIQEISVAADRAAALTNQLLIFSRSRASILKC
ncbi:MAG: hypothetical protein JXA89_28370 [Anaerolineae bacterium]|nr:hypothetical protein [Anaerolineae bacterium]